MNDMVLRNSFDARAARARCLRFRRRILDISQQVGALHIGSAYSCTEIVDCIYYGLMRRFPDGKSPDTFVMSKGHGCMIQYVILEELGILSTADIDAYCTPGGRLGVHPDYGNPGIEASTGALGHGLSMVVGMALAERGRGTDGVIYAVLSDGEVQEGSTWEAIMMASSFSCSNLVAFVDNNDFQSWGVPRRRTPRSTRWWRSSRRSAGNARGRRPRSRGDIPGRHQPQGDKPFMSSARPQRARASATGERADLALPLAQQDRIRAGLDRAGAGRVMRNTFSEALYRRPHQPRGLRRRRRHLAGRQHGQVQQRSIRALHQRRRRRAEHDRHLRRPCPQGLASPSPIPSPPSRSTGRSRWCATISATRTCP